MSTSMKSVQEKQTALFEKTGSFFAFSNKQFDEAKKEGVKYVHLGAGLICPKENVEYLRKELDFIHTKGKKARVKKFGLDAIIKDELNNYEVFYTGLTDEIFEILAEYGATPEQIKKVYYEVLPTIDL